MEFKGSRTEKNVLAAFAGESQARTRYSFFASVARKEGFEQIGAFFQQTSDEEKEHAKLFFKQLKGGDAEITAAYPAGVIGTTKDNLMAAARVKRWNGAPSILDLPRWQRMKGSKILPISSNRLAR